MPPELLMEQEAAGPLRSRPRWRCALRCTLTVASPHSTRMFGTTGPFASPQERPKTLSIALRFWVFGTWWRFLRGCLPRRTCAVAEIGSKVCGVELVVGWFLRRPWRCHPGRTFPSLHTTQGGGGGSCIIVQDDSIQSIACSMHDHPQQCSLW